MLLKMINYLSANFTAKLDVSLTGVTTTNLTDGDFTLLITTTTLMDNTTNTKLLTPFTLVSTPDFKLHDK